MKKNIFRLVFALFSVIFIAACSGSASVFKSGYVSVSKSVVLTGVNIDDVWSKVGGFCAISAWHPAVEKCDITSDGGAEFRILTLGDGAQIKEKYTGGKVYAYSYMITEGPLPVENYNSDFQAEQLGAGVKFTWSASFYPTDPKAEDIVSGIFDSGLQSIKVSSTAR